MNESCLRQLPNDLCPSSAGLLHSSGLAKRWLDAGVQWVCFFQDTNGLVFRALPAALGARPEGCLCRVGCRAQRRRTPTINVCQTKASTAAKLDQRVLCTDRRVQTAVILCIVELLRSFNAADDVRNRVVDPSWR